jgi:hypothetical protein
MKILFLTISNQQDHPLNKYTALHQTFDSRSWETGFRAVCSDVCILDFYKIFVSDGPLGMENRIRELVHDNNITLLIVPHLHFELAPTFLTELRAIGCRSLIVFFDDSMRFDDTNRFYLSAFDYFLAHESVENKALYKPHGIDAEFFPCFPSNSFYKVILQRFDKASVEDTSDVLFVGAKIADRDIFINYLKNDGINIRVYGKGWNAGTLSSEKMVMAYNSSKISLNFVKTIDDSGKVQLKGRLFEIIMAGGFVLSEHNDELSDYFEIGREIDTFRSPRELLDKVRFYLENSDLRNEMAQRASAKAEKRYSFEFNWLRYLMDIKNGTIKTSHPNPGYKVPAAAINSFFIWNISFIYGRLMLVQYSLAYDQYKFCQRELDALACDAKIARLFSKMVVKKLIIAIARCILSRNQRYRIIQWYSRRRGLANFDK